MKLCAFPKTLLSAFVLIGLSSLVSLADTGASMDPGHDHEHGPHHEHHVYDTNLSGEFNQTLFVRDQLISRDHRFSLIMQEDCNLVMYNEAGVALWDSRTHGRGFDCRAVMQHDGNFVVYNERGEPLFSTGTAGHPRSFLRIQDDSNLVIYEEHHHGEMFPIWHR